MIQQLVKMIENTKNEIEVLDMEVKSLEDGRMESEEKFNQFYEVLDARDAKVECLKYQRRALANLRYAAGHKDKDVDVFNPERF